MRLALIENKIVKNIILGDIAEFTEYVDVTDVICNRGDICNDDGTYTAPYVNISESESQWCDNELESIKVSKMKIYRDEIIVYKSNLKNNLPTNGRPQKP